jgi:hypothetical protein
MKNKLYLFIAFAAIMFLASCNRSINPYKDGSVWFCEGRTDEWPSKRYHEIYFIQGDTLIADQKYWKVYQKYLSGKAKYVYGLRAEKNKVFFAPKNHAWDLLIFDYNIKSGDIVKVYSTCQGFYSDVYPSPIEIICTGKSFMKSCGNTYEIFKIADASEGKAITWAQGEWIKGLGSVSGPIDNDYMQCFGGGSSVYELMVDGKIVWEDSIGKNHMNKILE